MNKNIKIIITLLVIAILAGFCIYFYTSQTDGVNLGQNTDSGETVEYKNAERGFTLDYPQELQVKDTDEGETTHTIVFSDSTGEKSFQIFFTPYFGDQITQSRILEDVPSGTFTEPIEVVIGGSIHALAFESTLDIGEIREVWFIHNGYLFEVSTYKDLDSWLAGIMNTWKFM